MAWDKFSLAAAARPAVRSRYTGAAHPRPGRALVSCRVGPVFRTSARPTLSHAPWPQLPAPRSRTPPRPQAGPDLPSGSALSQECPVAVRSLSLSPDPESRGGSHALPPLGVALSRAAAMSLDVVVPGCPQEGPGICPPQALVPPRRQAGQRPASLMAWKAALSCRRLVRRSGHGRHCPHRPGLAARRTAAPPPSESPPNHHRPPGAGRGRPRSRRALAKLSWKERTGLCGPGQRSAPEGAAGPGRTPRRGASGRGTKGPSLGLPARLGGPHWGGG